MVGWGITITHQVSWWGKVASQWGKWGWGLAGWVQNVSKANGRTSHAQHEKTGYKIHPGKQQGNVTAAYNRIRWGGDSGGGVGGGGGVGMAGIRSATGQGQVVQHMPTQKGK